MGRSPGGRRRGLIIERALASLDDFVSLFVLVSQPGFVIRDLKDLAQAR